MFVAFFIDTKDNDTCLWQKRLWQFFLIHQFVTLCCGKFLRKKICDTDSDDDQLCFRVKSNQSMAFTCLKHSRFLWFEPRPD
jgi:hypothetical protein